MGFVAGIPGHRLRIFLLGGVAGGSLPGLRVVCGLATLGMGAVACLAYMCIDLERNEVERGHKVVHNPLKGQILASNLERYGKQVGIPLLIAAAIALIGGFAFLNQGLYETIGKHWYQIADAHRQPIYADFLAYALTKILGLIDVLDLAKSHHILGTAFVRPAAWPASRAAGRVQGVLHTRVAPSDLCLAATRQAAGGDDR